MHKFNLIENARDSLEHALAHIKPIQSNQTGDWKRIIIDIAHAIELLLKEKLRQIHPAFVYDNIDKYPSKDAFTVGAEKTLKRLQNIGNITFSKEEIGAITSAREKRNEIEHYEFSITDKDATVLVGQALSFVFHFSDKHLNLDWKPIFFKDRKWSTLSEYTQFYENIRKTASDNIFENDIYVIGCTFCHNDTFDVEHEKCLVCGYEEKVHDCKHCREAYIYSSCEFNEEANLCPNCEYKEGYAAFYHEKY